MTDGAAYLAASANGATFQTGQDVVVRQQFVTNGELANSKDTAFRAISNEWPVFGIAHDLGTVETVATPPVVYVVGHARDPAIEYITTGGVLQQRSSYYWSAYSSINSAVRRTISLTAPATECSYRTVRSPSSSTTSTAPSLVQIHLMPR